MQYQSSKSTYKFQTTYFKGMNRAFCMNNKEKRFYRLIHTSRVMFLSLNSNINLSTKFLSHQHTESREGKLNLHWETQRTTLIRIRFLTVCGTLNFCKTTSCLVKEDPTQCLKYKLQFYLLNVQEQSLNLKKPQNSYQIQ